MKTLMTVPKLINAVNTLSGNPFVDKIKLIPQNEDEVDIVVKMTYNRYTDHDEYVDPITYSIKNDSFCLNNFDGILTLACLMENKVVDGHVNELKQDYINNDLEFVSFMCIKYGSDYLKSDFDARLVFDTRTGNLVLSRSSYEMVVCDYELLSKYSKEDFETINHYYQKLEMEIMDKVHSIITGQ